jgi:hypothetical protein
MSDDQVIQHDEDAVPALEPVEEVETDETITVQDAVDAEDQPNR